MLMNRWVVTKNEYLSLPYNLLFAIRKLQRQSQNCLMVDQKQDIHTTNGPPTFRNQIDGYLFSPFHHNVWIVQVYTYSVWTSQARNAKGSKKQSQISIGGGSSSANGDRGYGKFECSKSCTSWRREIEHRGWRKLGTAWNRCRTFET